MNDLYFIIHVLFICVHLRTVNDLYLIIQVLFIFNTFRLWLATLHFNENSQRTQAVTQDGKARYRVVFPKYEKGEYTVRKISVDSTYGKDSFNIYNSNTSILIHSVSNS